MGAIDTEMQIKNKAYLNGDDILILIFEISELLKCFKRSAF